MNTERKSTFSFDSLTFNLMCDQDDSSHAQLIYIYSFEGGTLFSISI